ncbi:hypothetical protein V8C86DRAFT_1361810 [Haematococcus lacustris]
MAVAPACKREKQCASHGTWGSVGAIPRILRRPLLFLIPAILICNVLAYFLFFSMQRSQLRHSSDMLPSDEDTIQRRSLSKLAMLDPVMGAFSRYQFKPAKILEYDAAMDDLDYVRIVAEPEKASSTSKQQQLRPNALAGHREATAAALSGVLQQMAAEAGRSHVEERSPEVQKPAMPENPERGLAVNQTTWPLWWFAPFFDRTSFGKEASTLLLGLGRSGAMPTENIWVGTTQGDCNYGVDTSMPRPDFDFLDAAKKRADPRASAIVVCHSLPPFWARPKNKWETCAPCPPVGYTAAVAVGRAMAETDIYHSEFVKYCNRMDEVWVPSQFSYDVLNSSGVDASKIRIVPIAVNTTLYNPEVVRAVMLPHGELVFGKAKRTLPPLPEFTSDDNVEMYILTKPFLNGGNFAGDMRTWVQQHLNLSQEEHSQLPTLYVISSHLTSDQYAGLYKAADAYVTPTRGEGWGMPITEAMSMGLPVVVTNWSGVTAFVDESVGYMVNYTLQTVPDDQPWWFQGAKWAVASSSHLRQRMREVMSDRRTAAAKGKRARQRMVKLYSPEAVGRLIAAEHDRLTQLLRSGTCKHCNNKQWVAPPGDTSPDLYTGREPFLAKMKGLDAKAAAQFTGVSSGNIISSYLAIQRALISSSQNAESWRELIKNQAKQTTVGDVMAGEEADTVTIIDALEPDEGAIKDTPSYPDALEVLVDDGGPGNPDQPDIDDGQGEVQAGDGKAAEAEDHFLQADPS